MARTKQSARQSTGDIALRAKLRPVRELAPVQPSLEEDDEVTSTGQKCKKRTTTKPATTKRAKTQVAAGQSGDESAKAKDEPLSPELAKLQVLVAGRVSQYIALGPIEVTEFSNSYCYTCQNGGSCITCDECPRIICLKHVPELNAIPEALRNMLHFRCPSCHTRGTKDEDDVAPYFGLYHVDSQGLPADPYLAHWASVSVHAARPQHIQVDTHLLLILSIHLVSLDENSSPARFLYHYLVPWFDGPTKSHLRYIDLPFSIHSIENADKYRAQWDEVLSALGPLTKTRIILFIYTHSHDESGDLFYAPKDSSEDLTEWWNHLVCAKLKQIARTPTNELTVAVLACGAVIRNERTLEQLATSATELGAMSMFAFAATHLQAVLTMPFFMNFAQRVYVEKTELKENNIATVLDQSLFLARHTPIWHFSRPTLKNQFAVRIFEWSHLTMRPHGEDLGLQCPGCGSLSSRKGKLLEDPSKKAKSANGRTNKGKRGNATSGKPADHKARSTGAADDQEKDGNVMDSRPILVACQKPGCQWSKTVLPPPTGFKRLAVGEKGQWRSRTVVLKGPEVKP